MSDDPGSFSIVSDDPDIQEKLDEYWNRRSRGYNLATMVALHDSGKDERLILDSLPLGKRSDILDIGTSCGYMAILAARAGHKVTAIDSVPSMIVAAEHNAKQNGVNIDFRVMDMNCINLERESFDLVIAKSAAWMLRCPVAAFRDWVALLRPGGRLLIIDGNYYLGHFDSDYAKVNRVSEITDSENKSMHGVTNMDGVNFNELHELSKHLPVAKVRRPSWDVSVLLGLGMEDIHVDCTDESSPQTLTSSGYLNIPRGFVVSARKPFKNNEDKYIGGVISPFEDPDGTSLLLLKSLSDDNRLRMVSILCDSPHTVSELSEITGISVALVSHNLKLLKQAGVVESIKKGKTSLFSLVRPDKVIELLYLISSLKTNS